MTESDLKKLEKLYQERDVLIYHSALPELIAEVKSLCTKVKIVREALEKIMAEENTYDISYPHNNCFKYLMKLSQQALAKIEEGKE